MQQQIPVSKIGKYLGLDINPATAHRWRINGVSHDGTKVKLRATKIGARFFVSHEDLKIFIDTLNISEGGGELISSVQVSAKNMKEVEKILDEFKV